MLDENSALIKTISDYQNAGKHSETVQYQWTLHRNLVYLASVADSNQNLQNLLPVHTTANIWFYYIIFICQSSWPYIITIPFNVSFSLLATYRRLYSPLVDHIPKIKANQIIRMHRLLQAVIQANHPKAAILVRLMAHKVLVDHQMVLLV